MLSSRLPLAVESGQFDVPSEGRIAVFAPTAGTDLSTLPRDRVVVITGLKPDFDAYAAAGYEVAVQAEGEFAAAIVCLTRAKAEAARWLRRRLP